MGRGGLVEPGLRDVYEGIDRYYTAKVRRFGPTPLGVDWSCVPTQELRFVQLLKLCDFGAPFSLNDLGCGYGALLAYLAHRHPDAGIDYLGIDLSRAMITRAARLWRNSPASFHHGHESPREADYGVASGIFNVQLDRPLLVWERFVETTLTDLHATSRRGFAVNFVAEPAIGRTRRVGLYCVSPSRWITHCERAFGAQITLIEGYGMSEFTLLVRRRSATARMSRSRPASSSGSRLAAPVRQTSASARSKSC
jgi:SAM-dependent methyltransferase